MSAQEFQQINALIEHAIGLDPFAINENLGGQTVHASILAVLVETAREIGVAATHFSTMCLERAQTHPQQAAQLMEAASEFNEGCVEVVQRLHDAIDSTDWQALDRRSYWLAIGNVMDMVGAWSGRDAKGVVQ